jgi:LacI family transcriptional regulator
MKGNESRKRVTLKVVAEATGYTVATVSMALRNRPQVNVRTRERIQRKALELGYVPDPDITRLMYRLRSERAASTQAALAYLTFFNKGERVQNPHLALGYRTMVEAAEAHGYALQEFFLPDYTGRPESLERILRSRGISGVIISGLRAFRERVEINLDRFSVSTTGMSLGLPIHRACQNQYADARQVLRHLLERGYRRIGLFLPRISDERVGNHYSAAFHVFNAERDRADRIEPQLLEEMTREAFLEGVERERPDVVVFHAPSPEIMYGWLTEAGYRIPEDIGMAALDLANDKAPYSGMVQNTAGAVRATVDLVVNQIMRDQRGFPEEPRVVLVEGRFHEGETVRALKPG